MQLLFRSVVNSKLSTQPHPTPQLSCFINASCSGILSALIRSSRL
jgi:hypothetical protein